MVILPVLPASGRFVRVTAGSKGGECQSRSNGLHGPPLDAVAASRTLRGGQDGCAEYRSA